MAETEAEIEVPKFSLNVIDTLRGLQQQNGLKSYDYQRYRQYCARRLQRIHKTLHLFAGSQKKYKGLSIQPEDVTEQRVLLLLILDVERAWAYAEQLKYDFSNTDKGALHRHYIARMNKCCKLGEKLTSVAQYVADERTQREIKAYVQEMEGLRAVAKGDHASAKKLLEGVNKEYLALQENSSPAVRTSLGHRIADVDQTIRFCAYSAGGKHGAEGTETSAGTSGGSVTWRGRKVPVDSDKVRVLLSTAETHIVETTSMTEAFNKDPSGSGLARFMDLYDKVFISFNDALALVKQDIAQERGEPAILHLLVNYLKYQLFTHTLRRNRALAKVHAARTEAQVNKAAATGSPFALSASKKEGKLTSTLDLARLHETVTQSIDNLLSIPGVDEDDATADPLNNLLLLHAALRYYYQAETLTSLEEWSHAMPLYEAAKEKVAEAMAVARQKSLDDEEIVAASQKIRAAHCMCKATAVLAQAAEGGPDDNPTADDRPARLDKNYAAFKTCAVLTQIPPDYVVFPCRPIVLDVAFHLLPKPSVAHRTSPANPQQKPAKPTTKSKPARSAEHPPAGASADEKKGWFGGWGWNK
ncbi:Signal recognition particle subunit SRP68 [Diplonema papillatum]|nr:Signal recognition particle subunit SRP68 [Diplonema papillatum]